MNFFSLMDVVKKNIFSGWFGDVVWFGKEAELLSSFYYFFNPDLIDRVVLSQINSYKHHESWVDGRNCVKVLFGRKDSALVLSFAPIVS